MTANDDYPVIAKYALVPITDLAISPALVLELGAVLQEIDRLRRWKAEAIEVLQHWDDVAVRFDLSGHLGEFTADAVGTEIDRLLARLAEAPPHSAGGR